jgi:hypothetical protein
LEKALIQSTALVDSWTKIKKLEIQAQQAGYSTPSSWNGSGSSASGGQMFGGYYAQGPAVAGAVFQRQSRPIGRSNKRPRFANYENAQGQAQQKILTRPNQRSL